MGWDVAIAFFILTSAIAVISGVILDKMGWSNQVKNVRLKGDEHGEIEEVPKGFKMRLKNPF